MCDPVTATIAAASTALSIGSTIMGHQGQKQAAADNRRAANVNFSQRTEAIDAQRVQLDQAMSEDVFERAIAQASAQGRIAASASDMGMGAQGLQQQRQVSSFEAGREFSIAAVNDRNQREQLQREMRGAETERVSQINQVKPPSTLSLLLGIGKAAVQGASTYSSLGGKFGG